MKIPRRPAGVKQYAVILLCMLLSHTPGNTAASAEGTELLRPLREETMSAELATLVTRKVKDRWDCTKEGWRVLKSAVVDYSEECSWGWKELGVTGAAEKCAWDVHDEATGFVDVVGKERCLLRNDARLSKEKENWEREITSSLSEWSSATSNVGGRADELGRWMNRFAELSEEAGQTVAEGRARNIELRRLRKELE